MKKMLSMLLAVVLTLSLFAGCAAPGKNGPEMTADEMYPMTVTDQVGREVTIDNQPETVVSGYYISTGMLIAMGQEDKIVGIENGAAKRNIYSLAAPDFLNLPSVGTAKDFDLETCASLNPDLVVLPAKLKDIAPSLEDLGIDVLFVKPEDQALLEEAINLLGKVLNCTDAANSLISYTDNSLNDLSDALKGADKPSVYMAGNSDFLSTAGALMYQNTLIEHAGGANVAAEIQDSYWAEVSYEQLLSWNPAYIILAADAKYTVEDVLNNENLADCDAVVNGNVFKFPNTVEAWDSPIPGGVLGSLWLASVLHPDCYSADDFNATAADFYNTFYQFTYEG